MTKVKITYQSNKIVKITVKGHAGFADKGEDLVCAGVSSIVFGTMNAIEELCSNHCVFDIIEANVSIVVKKDSEKLNTMLEMMVIQLLSIAESYPSYLKIEKEEV